MHAQLAARILGAATVCVALCALLSGQPPGRAEWLLVPQFARGQEFTYSGWFTEEKISGGVRAQSAYRLESTLLVLGAAGNKWDVAFLTALSRRDHLPGQPAAPAARAAPASVRLEVAEVDRQGRVRSKSGAALAVPLDGPPTAECGALVEVPRSYLRPGDNWPAAEAGRPTRVWHVAGTEPVNSTLCVKLVGLQQSDDWDRPRADHDAWRRVDTVWLSPQQGVACKVKRVLERRDAARDGPTYRAVAEYERDGQMSYPGRLFDACCREVEQAVKFQEEAAPLLRQPAMYRPQIESLLRRIALQLEQPPTVGPYRKAVLQLQKRVEAARRGETTPDPISEPGPVIASAAVGQRVPDFAVTELVTHETVQLYRRLGKPLVLVFYNPATEIGREVLRFAQQLTERDGAGLTVLALAVTDDEEQVRKQQEEMRLTLPLLDGTGLVRSFGVDATPRLVVLDGDGVLRGASTGWGAHTPQEVLDLVRRCGKK